MVRCQRIRTLLVTRFPAEGRGEILGLAFVKAVNGRLLEASLMLTGGAGLENVGQWVEAGAVAFRGGGNLTVGAVPGEYEAISKLAREPVGKGSKRSAGNEHDKILELRRRAFCSGTA